MLIMYVDANIILYVILYVTQHVYNNIYNLLQRWFDVKSR